MLVWAVWLSILLNVHTEKDNRQTYTQQCPIHTLVHFLPLPGGSIITACIITAEFETPLV